MQNLFVLGFKVTNRLTFWLIRPLDQIMTWFTLYSNGIHFSSFRSSGCPKINVGLGGKCTIGFNFKINNRESSNPIGRFNRCSIVVGKVGNLVIGNNVGMSSTAIFCQSQIYIGNNVNLGGNVVIYDTDFHSLNPVARLIRKNDMIGTKTAPVKIGDSVFIGAHATILKGVSIGDNVIIGACSVVTKSIPNNEIWAGNPAKFIRRIND